jgi:hypothetical protein
MLTEQKPHPAGQDVEPVVSAAAAINADLIAEDTPAAVAAHRADPARAQTQASTPSSGLGTRVRSSAAAST